MVTRSLFTGVSGLQAHLEKTDVLSNNISNINTAGFKKSNVTFSSFLSQNLSAASGPEENRGGTNPQQIGLGVQVSSISKDMSQGQLERTGVDTDLAVQGEGFFATQEAGSSRRMYTRAGSFQFDSDQQLVDPSTGNRVIGNMVNEDFELQDTEEAMQIESFMRSMEAQQTTEMEFEGNLDAAQEVGMESTKITEFSPGGPLNSYASDSESDIRFDFKRFHPTKKIYKFEGIWASNPPTGKQIGSKVEDQVTGEDLEGIIRLNDDDSVEGVYRNPDREGMNGVARVEVADDNSADYRLNRDGIMARNQEQIFGDLNDMTDGRKSLRLRMGGPSSTHAADEFKIEWKDDEGAWNAFTDAGGDVVHNISEINGGTGIRLNRETDAGNTRNGELQIGGNFLEDVSGGTENDEIYFQVHPGDGNEILQREGEVPGETPRDDFRWAGPGGGTFITSNPDSVIGDSELGNVYNYDESNMNNIGDASNITTGATPPAGLAPGDVSINDGIENKEFVVVGTGPEQYEVYADANNDGSIVLDQGGPDQLQDAAGNTTFSSNSDVQLHDPAGNDLGLSIAAEDWSSSPASGDVLQFSVTDARTPGGDSRPFSVVEDKDGGLGSILLPNEGANAPSFSPDTVGLTSGDGRLAADGKTDDITIRSDESVQVTASAEAFDSQGAQHTLTYRFEKQDTNEWMWHAMDPTPEELDNPRMAGFGKIEFDENGRVKTSDPFAAPTALNRPPGGPEGDITEKSIYFNPPAEELQGQTKEVGAEPVTLDPIMSQLTQFAGNSDAEIGDQDGNSAGSLEEMNFDQDGKLNASYDNGESRVLGRISLARFRNPEGLEEEGGTYFTTSANSGPARLRNPNEGGRGSIAPGTLERSNVDMSQQFTQLISTQRGFQANSRTISTTDQMIQELLRLR